MYRRGSTISSCTEVIPVIHVYVFYYSIINKEVASCSWYRTLAPESSPNATRHRSITQYYIVLKDDIYTLLFYGAHEVWSTHDPVVFMRHMPSGGHHLLVNTLFLLARCEV